MAGDFWNKIRRVLHQPQQQGRQPQQRVTPMVPSQQPHSPQPRQQTHGPLDMNEKDAVIREAGRSLKKLYMVYDGVPRLVEPYSYRQKWTGRLFYGFCELHNRIHSFRLEKMQDLKITDFSYVPRNDWDVEF